MSRADFYQQHLNRVSRSFAYCIGNLNAPLKAWVGLTYLICRVLDTVEDAPWLRPKDQLNQFDQFNQFLMNMPPEELVSDWCLKFPTDIPEGEKALLDDSHNLFRDLHEVPDGVRVVISDMVLSMSRGMKHFAAQKQKHNGVLKLNTLKEVNQYCFFVAGIVGEALARLVAHIEPQFQVVKHRVLDAHHFGLFLQKVNLLKDQMTDAEEGRQFVFDRDEIYSSLSVNAHGAFRFLSAIPLRQREFRLFCAWSLFLGLASLPWLEKFFDMAESGKLPRDQAQEVFAVVEQVIDSPEKTLELFEALLATAELSRISDEDYLLGKDSVAESSQKFPDSLYHGSVDPMQVASLGF